jgi:antiviral helicase SLH1
MYALKINRVNRYQGLFYFDASFRPVPLEQHFIGVKGKAGSMLSRNSLDSACFDKANFAFTFSIN